MKGQNAHVFKDAKEVIIEKICLINKILGFVGHIWDESRMWYIPALVQQNRTNTKYVVLYLFSPKLNENMIRKKMHFKQQQQLRQQQQQQQQHHIEKFLF
jgi:hypothetical protein